MLLSFSLFSFLIFSASFNKFLFFILPAFFTMDVSKLFLFKLLELVNYMSEFYLFKFLFDLSSVIFKLFLFNFLYEISFFNLFLSSIIFSNSLLFIVILSLLQFESSFSLFYFLTFSFFVNVSLFILIQSFDLSIAILSFFI